MKNTFPFRKVNKLDCFRATVLEMFSWSLLPRPLSYFCPKKTFFYIIIIVAVSKRFLAATKTHWPSQKLTGRYQRSLGRRLPGFILMCCIALYLILMLVLIKCLSKEFYQTLNSPAGSQIYSIYRILEQENLKLFWEC